MGRSMAPGSLPSQLALAGAPVEIGRFRVFRRGRDLYQSETEVNPFGAVTDRSTYKIEYVIGSGRRGYAYIVKRGERLVEAPLSYYAKSGKWDLSPGYDDAEPGFDRFITADCLACHAGRVRAVTNRLGVYREPPFLELAIGCENCHGPGGRHVASEGRLPMLNPAKLGTRESEAICLKCHQSAEASPNSDLLAHATSMQRSRCYLASSGRLTCTTCHDPHEAVSSTSAPAYYRSKCLICHTDTSCSLPLARRGARNDCAGCHMPKRNLSEIPHTALTSHEVGLNRP